MRSLHEICCHLERGYTIWKEKNRVGFRDDLQALKHVGKRNIPKWRYDKQQIVKQLEATGVLVDNVQVKDLLVKATGDVPK